MTLATNVLKVRYSLRTTPLRIVFISGIPEPRKWKERDARCDDGVQREDELKESNYTERERDEENKWRANGGRERGEGERLIDIHIVFCMHIASEVYIIDSLTTWPLIDIWNTSLGALRCIIERTTSFKLRNVRICVHMFLDELLKSVCVCVCVCVCVSLLPTAWGASICVNPAEKVMSTTG